MGVSLEVYRSRIGCFSNRSGNQSDKTCRFFQESKQFGLLLRHLPVFILCALLVISGVELNPGPTEFKCKYCKLVLDSAPSYLNHMKLHRHQKKFSFPCCFENCSRELSSLVSFNSHRSRYHQREESTIVSSEQIVCPVATCKCLINSRKFYLKHMSEHLNKGESFKCALPKCETFSDTIPKFKTHVSRYHPSETFLNVCDPVSRHPLVPSVTEAPPKDEEGENDFGNDFDENEIDFSDDTPLREDEDSPDQYPDHVIKDELAKFYLRLEGEFVLPTSTVQVIAEQIKLVTELSHYRLRRTLKLQLKESGLSDEKVKSILRETFKCDTVFNIHHKNEDVEQLGTHHLRSKFWRKRFPYVEPKEITFGHESGGKVRRAHYVSMRETLQILLSDESIKKSVQESFSLVPNLSVLTDFTDGSAFSDHKCVHHQSGKCLQLLLFEDAFEFNPFGPASGVYKPIGFYYTLGNISAEFRSKVDLIQLVYMLLDKDTKSTDEEELNDEDILKKALSPLLEELQDLKLNGINLDGENVPVCLLFMLGDSAGQHHMGSYVRSFAAEFFCRFCPISRKEFHEKPDSVKPFRNPEDYDDHVKKAKLKWIQNRARVQKNLQRKTKRKAQEVSARCSAPGKKILMRRSVAKSAMKKLRGVNFRGVKYRPSPFNSEILNFHVASPALPPCISHDIHEGILKCVLPCIFKYFIEKKKWFDLTTLNRRIKAFRCKGSDARDAPTPLKKLDELSGNAVENWNLLRLLPFIIGDLIQDVEDEMWLLYLTLKEINDIVCAPQISLNQVGYLQFQIRSYLTRLKELSEHFPKCLIPKQHFLRHYPELIIMFGPLIRLFTLRFESKHVFFKRVVRACKSYVNITYTLAQKYMSRFAYDHTGELLSSDIQYNPNHSVHVNLQNISGSRKAAIESNFDVDNVEALSCVVYKGVKYEKGHYLILSSEGIKHLEIGCVDMIFLDSTNTLTFLLEIKSAANTYNGFYEIEKASTPPTYRHERIENLADYYPLPSYEYLGKECLTLKHSIKCFM